MEMMSLFGHDVEAQHVKMLVFDITIVYIQLWKKGKMVKFNLVTCIFGVTWMVYRKMYVEALLFTLLTYIAVVPLAFLAGIISYFLKMDLSFVPIIWAYLFTWVILGFFGKYIYAKHITRKLRKLLDKHEGEEGFSKLLYKKGGTTHPLIIFGYVVFIVAINSVF